MTTITECLRPLPINPDLVEIHNNNWRTAHSLYPPMMMVSAEIVALASAVSGLLPGVITGKIKKEGISRGDVRTAREAIILLWWKHGSNRVLLDLCRTTDISRSGLQRAESSFKGSQGENPSHHWPIQMFLGAEQLASGLRNWCESPSVDEETVLSPPISRWDERAEGVARFKSHYLSITGGEWFRKE